MPHTLTADELSLLDAWWRAANYLTVGQIYLQANPLLREPLRPEHIKPRLLGHWGTSPGLSLLYAHLNRLIRKRNIDAIFLAGPGHGGPSLIANVWLEGTWSEIYPEVPRDGEGMRRLFRQFSTPYGVPSHVSPPVPGSIHEGGELGYVLTHAFGAAFDNPDLLVVAVVGDGEAETAPLEGSWKGVSFLQPARDGAVLPVLHLNGYKIANPTVLARKDDEEVASLLRGHGYEPFVVAGNDPLRVHAALAETLDACHDRIREIQQRARGGSSGRPRWPMIVLRTPKGWTGPQTVDGVQVEGTFRAHQVPIAQVRENPDHLRRLGPLTPAHVHLGVIDAERLDFNHDMASHRLRLRQIRIDQAVEAAELFYDDRTHSGSPVRGQCACSAASAFGDERAAGGRFRWRGRRGSQPRSPRHAFPGRNGRCRKSGRPHRACPA